MKKRILVIDVGGTHVKLMISRAKKQKFKSGPKLMPREMVAEVKGEVEDWKFDAISIGFPAPVRDGRIIAEPKHLDKGWVRFNFEKAFGIMVAVFIAQLVTALGNEPDAAPLAIADLEDVIDQLLRLRVALAVRPGQAGMKHDRIEVAAGTPLAVEEDQSRFGLVVHGDAQRLRCERMQ